MTITALSNIPSINDPTNFETEAEAFFVTQLPLLVTEVNAATLAMSLNATSDTSASSVAIGTGAKSFTVSASKSFLGGMFLVIADDAAPSTNWMIGQVTSYSGTALVMNITAVGGSGTKTAWTISQSAVGLSGGAVAAAPGANADITSLSALTSVPLNLDLPMINGYIDWSISGNALTAAVKTYAGTDPSATNPVFAVFRNPTLTTSGYYSRPITAALSVTASSGSSLGTVSAQASRIRAVLMDNAGAVVIGLYNAWNDTTKSVVGLNEGAAYSSTAEGGAGAADSAQVIYTTSAQTSKAIREVSYTDSTQTTAGTWAQALTNEVQITATTPKAGAVLQEITSASGAVMTGTNVTPTDDTIPQTSESNSISALNVTLTPASASNAVSVSVNISECASSVANEVILALFEDAVASALAVTVNRINVGGLPQSLSLNNYKKIVNTTSSKTFKPYIAPGAAGTVTVNGTAGARDYGGVNASNCTVKEIMV